MAEWMDVMNQFNRMCWYYQRKDECPMGCPMNGVNISQCRKIAFECPEVTEKTVMDWATEHPELVYPNWSQWLISIGVIPKEIDISQYHAIIELGLIKPIPADIAEKLGIEPKEDIC